MFRALLHIRPVASRWLHATTPAASWSHAIPTLTHARAPLAALLQAVLPPVVAAAPAPDAKPPRTFGSAREKTESEQGQSSTPPPRPPTREASIMDYLVTGAIIMMLNLSSSSSPRGSNTISFQEFLTTFLPSGEVEKLEIDMNAEIVYVYLHDGAVINGKRVQGPSNSGPAALRQFKFSIGSTDQFEKQLIDAQTALGITGTDFVPVTFTRHSLLSTFASSILPIVVVVGGLVYLLRRPKDARRAAKTDSTPFSPTSFMAKGFKPEPRKRQQIKFSAVAGLTEAKQEVMEFVDYLKHPEHIRALGARIPKGALLVGPPGTGKTLLAKAVAGEAGVPFFAVAGSDFVEMFVGVGSARVRELFANARAKAPAIIYIDEIDAIGQSRQSSTSTAGGNDEREAALNQLLVEMDGFSSTDGLIMFASTNRADLLDSALLRPGRFDRQIPCDLPIREEREEIFRVHLKNITAAADVLTQVPRLALLTPGMSGAEIAGVCNEAALLAARRAGTVVTMDDFDAAIDRVVSGLERKRVLSTSERKHLAIHEAGHAILGWHLEHIDPLMKLSLSPRGQKIGVTQYMPSDLKLYTTEQLLDRMCALLGGRAAESLTYSTVSTASQDDLERVTKLAYQMVAQFGMSSKIGTLHYKLPKHNEGRRTFSRGLAANIDAEVASLVSMCAHRAETLLLAHAAALQPLATTLVDREMVTYDDVLAILGPRSFQQPRPYQVPV